MTKQFIVVLTVDAKVSKEELNELLCKQIHEGDIEAGDKLAKTVHNIDTVGEIQAL